MHTEDSGTHVTSILILGDNLLIGRADGGFYRCSTAVSNECHQIKAFEHRVNGLSYDSYSKKIFVALGNCKLFRCVSVPEKMDMCSRETYDYDTWITGLTSVHYAYEAIWIGVGWGELRRCPWTFDNYPRVECELFGDLGWNVWSISQPTFYKIRSRGDGYVYASYSGYGVDEMWRCDPNVTVVAKV